MMSGLSKSDNGRLVLGSVRLIDPEREVTEENPCDVHLDRGRIAQIVPSGAIAGEGAPVIDGGGMSALPGLIDCHCHLTGIFLPEISRRPPLGLLRWMSKQIDLNLRAHLRSGVTTARDMMAPLRVILRFRSRAEEPRSGYPRVLCAGPMLTVPGGYPAFVRPDFPPVRLLAGPLRVELRRRRDAIRWVDRLADAGVDWIKVGFSSRDYDNAGTPLAAPSPALMQAVYDRAHLRGLPVAVHHTWLTDLGRLLDLPFDTLEHLPLDDDVPNAMAEHMAERGLPVTSDLEVWTMLDGVEEALHAVESGDAPLMPVPRRAMAQAFQALAAGHSPNPHFGLDALRGAAARKVRNLKLLADCGILIGAGTDAGTNLMFGSLPDELRRMVRAGLKPPAALRAATTDAARLLRRDDLGRIATGYRADILLYDQDPLNDLDQLRDPALVVRDGVPVAGRLAR